MKKIPLYTMREHSEAFYYWNLMVNDKVIPSSGNFLFHLDHHSDFTDGGYMFDVSMLKNLSLEQAKTLAYEKLGIAEFIVPAIFEGLFNEIHFMQELAPAKLVSQKKTMYQKFDTELYSINYIPFAHGTLKKEKNPKYAFYEYHTGGLSQEFKELYKNKNIVFDVDLDYFCWDDTLSTCLPKRVEVTKEAWEQYNSDFHSPFRLFPKKWFFMVEDGGKYYLEYNYHSKPDPLPSKEMIEKRMDNLFSWLKACKIDIAAMDICSSDISGFLPADLYPWIQDTFLKKFCQNGFAYELRN